MVRLRTVGVAAAFLILALVLMPAVDADTGSRSE
jgi:hypothetical protein